MHLASWLATCQLPSRGIHRYIAVAALLSICLYGTVSAAPPSDLRDPFTRPDPPRKEPGQTINRGSPRIPAGADGRPESKPPREPSSPKATSPMTPLDTMVFLYSEWIKATFRPLWQPTVVFVADQTRAYATEAASKTLADMTFTYLAGRGWKLTTVASMAPAVISGGFIALDLIWPSDIGMEPTPAEMEQLVKRLEEQRKREPLPETRKRPVEQVPDAFRNPSSLAAPINVSTEEERRLVMFAAPNITREEARSKLVRGTGIVHGPIGARLLDAMLWLFDIQRIEREGLSEEAGQLFNDLVTQAKEIQGRRNKKLFHNACLIAPPNWNGDPLRWTCSLPATQDYESCFCPPPPNRFGNWISGYPTRMDTGQVCVIDKVGICPMMESSPVAGFCQCPEFPGSFGQVRK